MSFVQTYDAIIRALPVILVTGIIPPEAITEWTWLTTGLSGVLFILTVPDMRNQRAVWIFNRIAREDREENGYWSQWSTPIGQDRIPSLLTKLMFVEYVVLMFANRTLAIHLFATLFGLVCLIMAGLKYDPAIQEKLAADHPSLTGPPTERSMARLWLFAGTAGVGLTAVLAVACFAFGLSFYYHFGPLYGEQVSAPVMAAILTTLALAFALLALRGWRTLRKRPPQ